jgi:hypothetical protein
LAIQASAHGNAFGAEPKKSAKFLHKKEHPRKTLLIFPKGLIFLEKSPLNLS